MTRLEPKVNMADGSKSKAGRNHETTDESTIESEVAKPWAMRGVEVKWRTRGPRARARGAAEGSASCADQDGGL